MKRPRLFKRVENKVNLFTVILALLCLSVLTVSRTQANNISASIVTPATDIDYANGYVTFTISWDHSWGSQDGTGNATTAVNWDAAWVFVKWRDCTAPLSTQFTHGLISTVVSDHSFNLGTTTFQPTDRYGNVNVIDGGPDNTGVMIRNQCQTCSGTVTGTIKLKLNNLPATGTFDFRIFAIEMVFVPQSPFVLGDANGASASMLSFNNATNASPPSPYAVASEDAQTVFDNNAAVSCNSCVNTCPCFLLQPFPKGYNAFYIMKYEISQGQYAEFLNAIPSYAQSVHWDVNNFTNYSTSNRYAINQISPGTFTTTISGNDKKDRACNFLSWPDVAAYLQWAAMRPLTELEYEKACRGTNPAVLGEAAWGNNTVTPATTISGTENGTEVISSPANSNVSGGFLYSSISAYSGGDGNPGPLRCGIFATGSTTSRQAAGMSFYGALDLSGNVSEYYICAPCGKTGSPCATGISEGNGMLDPNTGYATMSNWPHRNTITQTAGTSQFVIVRGGSFLSRSASAAAYNSTSGRTLNVSDRYQNWFDPNCGGITWSGCWYSYTIFNNAAASYGASASMNRNGVIGGRGGR